MILIADSGSTKTEWWAVEDHQAVAKVRTRGLNPFQVTMDELAQVVREEVAPAVKAATGTTVMASAVGNTKAEGGKRNAEGGTRKAEGGTRNAEGGKRNAEGGRLTLDSVQFYGAGCTKEKIPEVAKVLREALTEAGLLATERTMTTVMASAEGNTKAESGTRQAEGGERKAEGGRRKAESGKRKAENGTRKAESAVVEVASDMLGAARAVCGREAGIACILGTGSNSCEYDGEKITRNVPALGYILGDEGSGAVIGRQLLGDILKGVAPVTVRQKFEEQYGLTQAMVLDRVYRQAQPNQFLASFMPFVEANIGEEYMQELVKSAFTQFLVRNVAQYDSCHRVPIGFNGSIAVIYRKQLEEALEEQGMRLGRIVRNPMEGLV